MPAIKYILAVDHFSTFKKGHIYALKGTEVTEVTRNVDVLIVEDKKGERFSIHIKKLIPK